MSFTLRREGGGTGHRCMRGGMGENRCEDEGEVEEGRAGVWIYKAGVKECGRGERKENGQLVGESLATLTVVLVYVFYNVKTNVQIKKHTDSHSHYAVYPSLPSREHGFVRAIECRVPHILPGIFSHTTRRPPPFLIVFEELIFISDEAAKLYP